MQLCQDLNPLPFIKVPETAPLPPLSPPSSVLVRSSVGLTRYNSSSLVQNYDRNDKIVDDWLYLKQCALLGR